MPALDLRTIVFLTGAIGALMSVVLFFMHRSYGHSIRGIRQWAWGPLLIFLSTLLLGLRGLAHEWLTVVMANLVLLGGAVLLFAGTRYFYGERLPRWIWPALLATAVGLYLWGVAMPHYNARLLLVSAFMAALQAYHFWTVWRHDRHSFSARFMLTALGCMVVLMLLRAFSAPWLSAGANLFEPTPLQSAYIGGYAFFMMSLTVGCVLLLSERLRQELQHLISHDTLTGALSRHALFQRGHEEIERARRTRRPLTVLMLDLDHFKRVNDQHGHLTGDQVLRDFALRVRDELRQMDFLGRFGGEEFMVVLPETDGIQARHVTERIRVSRPAHPHLPGCSVSIGMATLQPSASAHRPSTQAAWDQLIARADEALYEAKAAGRDCVVEAALHTA